MLISPAYAQAGGAPGGFDLISLMPLVLIFVVFYFLLIRPQQKKMKTHREMIGAIKRGDKVLTAGGIIGSVVKVEESEDVLLVEIAKDIRVRVAPGGLAACATRVSITRTGRRAPPVRTGGESRQLGRNIVQTTGGNGAHAKLNSIPIVVEPA
jgi:preprotein translocase subunit YajC